MCRSISMPFLVLSWLALFFLPPCHGYNLDSLTGSLLREVVGRMGGPERVLATNLGDYAGPIPVQKPQTGDFPGKSYAARREAVLGPSIRAKEFLEHSSLSGHKSIEGGAGEGQQQLKPDGSVNNYEILKSDSLPSYCLAPNPCPLGYKADDGCLEEFENTAAFSRDYQARQNCMCDTEHMFDCPGATRENEIDALARSFESEGLAEMAINRLFQDMEIRGDHKVVAKKYFSSKPKNNPYLEGKKLPVVAKKIPSEARN